MIQLFNKISSTKHSLERLKKQQDIANKYNISLDQILDLSGGQNLFIPPHHIQKIIMKEIQSIDPRDSYPIDYYAFIDELSRFVGVKPSAIYPGLTHNQLIQRMISTITNPNDNILLLSPDKEIYFQIANNQRLNIETISLTGKFELNVDEILDKIKQTNAKTLIFSSPHYPTANQFDEQRLLLLAKETEIPIIVDESYVEFGKYSLVKQVQYYNNLSIVRSFSKAWGLGAFSCAYLVSDTSWVNNLKERYFFEEIPPTHLLVTTDVLRAPYRFVELINGFISERKRVIEHLKMLSGIKVYKSDTNFLFIQFKENVKTLYDQLCSKGIIVQIFDSATYFKNKENSFLATLGDNSVNDRFILALIETLESIL